MKFLCVPCNKPMELDGGPKKEQGSISLVYGCPDCGYEFAMLTNPMETQVVGSLGVKIGAGDGSTEGSKCPFTGMVQGMDTPGDAPDGVADPVVWTEQAEARMANVPEFVKPMVRSGIEKFARERGYARVDEQVLDEAKSHLGI